MSIRFLIGVAPLLLTLVSASPTLAFWGKPSRLEALAARQNLRDLVCIALADGQVTAWERGEIIGEAKQILSPGEYVSFRRAFNRIAPAPKPSAAQRSAKLAAKKPASKPRPTAKPPAGQTPEPVIPAGAILPDWMASGDVVR